MKEDYVLIVCFTMVGLMLVAVLGGLWNRHRARGEKDRIKGIGYRFVQFVGLAWLIGATVILSLTSHLSSEATATILGAVAGYLFGMRRPRPST